ncbi:AraC family transcriptional regulator [Rhodopseudomonas palustris]|uniref:Transcriptional regulator, AraC family n=1 Tax=Rhodopseudomonas palustris (strain DX-1) TaxID=652103 RepID=E6VEM9_RHOPX|nr:AraC family transcriptional regulator [Rhodopseudomonas palustris]QDL96788.1 AraC family transcriptional regulator [Rhodopseudomonas palustris]
MERRTIAPLFVEEVADCLVRAGIAPGPVFASAGLPEVVRERVSAAEFGALWLAVAAAMDDEFFGLGGRPMRPGSFTLLGHAVLNAGTLHQALNRALRFLKIALDDPSGELRIEDGLARIVLRDKTAPRSAFAYRTFWIVVHGIACWLVGRRLPLRRVDFACGPPAFAADYRSFFGAPVRFGQPESALVFDAAFLALRTNRTERALKEFLRRAPANILVRYRHDATLTAAIRTTLRAKPPTAWPNFETLARQMKIPASTLRRRLSAEGQTYQTIKDEIRRALAIRWLADNEKPVGDIAADLGFAEPSAFHRAFRKWMAKSPGAFRREAIGG